MKNCYRATLPKSFIKVFTKENFSKNCQTSHRNRTKGPLVEAPARREASESSCISCSERLNTWRRHRWENLGKLTGNSDILRFYLGILCIFMWYTLIK